MYVVAALEQYSGLDEPRYAAVSVSKWMDCDQEEMRQQCPYYRMLFPQPSTVYEINILVHESADFGVRSAYMNTTRIRTSDLYRKSSKSPWNIINNVRDICNHLVHLKDVVNCYQGTTG